MTDSTKAWKAMLGANKSNFNIDKFNEGGRLPYLKDVFPSLKGKSLGQIDPSNITLKDIRNQATILLEEIDFSNLSEGEKINLKKDNKLIELLLPEIINNSYRQRTGKNIDEVNSPYFSNNIQQYFKHAIGDSVSSSEDREESIDQGILKGLQNLQLFPSATREGAIKDLQSGKWKFDKEGRWMLIEGQL